MIIRVLLLFSFVGLLTFIIGESDEAAKSIPKAPEKRIVTIPPAVGIKLRKIFAGNQKAPEDKDVFELKMAKTLDAMPTLTRQRPAQVDFNNEIHGFLPEEFAEGHRLAQLRKLTLQHESYLPSSQNTYAVCAERTDLSDSVRAICFMRALEISIKLKNPEHIVALNVPANVRELALKLIN